MGWHIGRNSISEAYLSLYFGVSMAMYKRNRLQWNFSDHCNIAYFCREGSEAGLGAVATGSHVDAIPFSGKYDGVVGVLGALEAIRMLKRCKYYLKVSYHFSKNLVLLVLPMLYAFSFIKYHDELPMELSLTQCIIQCTQVCNTHMGIRHSQFHYTA